jgi:hypothetical protein
MKTINNGNPAALIYVFGRMAYLQNKSIFDCPHEPTDSRFNTWTDGYVFEEKKILNKLTY